MGNSQPPVLVTGSTGFIGRRVGRALAERFTVVGLDRPPEEGPAEVWEEMDLTSDDSVRRALGRVRDAIGTRIESVVHLAAYYDFSGEPSPLYQEVTVRGTGRLMAGLRDLGIEVGQYVYSSTMLVHAPCKPGQRINEDWPLDAAWDYPKSKLEAERLIQAERGRAPVVLLRIAGVYDDGCHSIPLAHQVQRIYERRMTARVFPGDTSTGQSYVHVDDVVDAILHAVDRREVLPPEAVLLIGEDEALSYDELQRSLAWLIHGEEKWDTTQIPKAVAKAGAWVQGIVPGVEEPFIKPWMIDLADDHYELDTSRAQRLFGWRARRSLRETLPRMVEALKDDPAAFYKANRLEGPPPRVPVGGGP